jgi:hypothetical protein
MEEIQQNQGTTEPTSPSPSLTDKRKVLFIYVPLFLTFITILSVVFAAVLEEDKTKSQVFDLVTGVGLNICALAWCRFDSRERGYQLSRHFPIAIVLLGAFALLYYLFRSRGLKGGFISVGWLLIYIAVCVVAISIVGVVIMLLLLLTGVVPLDSLATKLE